MRLQRYETSAAVGFISVIVADVEGNSTTVGAAAVSIGIEWYAAVVVESNWC